MKKYTLILLLLCCQQLCKAQSVSGNWTSSVPSNTITEAGSDYSSNWTSLSNQSIISLPSGVLGASYTVFVRKTDTNWNSNLSLWIHKSADNLGLLGSVSPAGNTSYFQLSASNQTFFTASLGILSPATFNVQYEIRGLSVTIPAQTYSTTVVYTISSP